MSELKRKGGAILQALAGLAGKSQPSVKTHDDAGYPIQANRRGKKAVITWLDPAVAAQLKDTAHEEETTQQALIREGLNLMFRKHGKPEIA